MPTLMIKVNIVMGFFEVPINAKYKKREKVKVGVCHT